MVLVLVVAVMALTRHGVVPVCEAKRLFALLATKQNRVAMEDLQLLHLDASVCVHVHMCVCVCVCAHVCVCVPQCVSREIGGGCIIVT